MCKNPAKGVSALLLAWETPLGQEALRGSQSGSMSIEFSRELLKAYVSGGRPVKFELCKRVRDRVFWSETHPCCVIDVRDSDKAALRKRIGDLEPPFVLLLGSKVQNMMSVAELEQPGRTVLSLGFPYGGNQRENVERLVRENLLRQLLIPALTN